MDVHNDPQGPRVLSLSLLVTQMDPLEIILEGHVRIILRKDVQQL